MARVPGPTFARPIDPASGRLFPFCEGEAVFIAEFADEIGDLAPRSLLQRQLTRAADMGYAVTAGFEYEFFILDETPASVRAKGYRDLASWQPGNSTYSLVPAIETDFFAGLERTMDALDVHFDAIHTEQGPGCVETPMKARDGLAAADAAGLFKAYAKAYCQRQGLMATFMAKWSNATNGQSGHLHISLQDADGGPVFHDAADPDGMSRQLRHFVGGLVRLLPETLVMCSHTVNAYRRMVPGIWAPLTAAWGIQNRTCAFRIINSEPEATRVEFRVPAADANPHLTLAQCLGAGLWGIDNKIEPPAPLSGRGDGRRGARRSAPAAQSAGGRRPVRRVGHRARAVRRCVRRLVRPHKALGRRHLPAPCQRPRHRPLSRRLLNDWLQHGSWVRSPGA